MSTPQGFKDLRVWQEAMDFAVKIFKLTEDLPKHEVYGLCSQLRRSAVSVPSNIAEGWGRKGNKEFAHFLDIAYGSICELDTQLELVYRCYCIEISELSLQCQSIRKQMFHLRKKVEQGS